MKILTITLSLLLFISCGQKGKNNIVQTATNIEAECTEEVKQMGAI